MSSSQRAIVLDDSVTGVAHDLFIKRTAFGALDDRYLNEVVQAEELAILEDGHSAEVLYELAFILVQRRPTTESLTRARELLHQAEGLVDEPLQPKMSRLGEIIERSLRNVLKPVTTFDRVNWAVNNECPETCPGCYQNFSPNQLDLDSACHILEWLDEAGIRRLILSGGDPLLWEALPEFLGSCVRLGFSVGIDTTGYTLDEPTVSLLRRAKVAYVGIPLDAPDNARQSQLRFSRTSDLVDRQLLALFELHRAGIPVKINTVVSAKNAVWLPEIAQLLLGLSDRPDYWSLFQWSPLRANEELRKEMHLDSEKFSLVARAAEITIRPTGVRVRKQTLSDRDMSHLFINNDGRVTTFGIEPGEEILLGLAAVDPFRSMALSPLLRRDTDKHVPVDRFERTPFNPT